MYHTCLEVPSPLRQGHRKAHCCARGHQKEVVTRAWSKDVDKTDVAPKRPTE